MAHCALIIDDEADIRELIAMALSRIGFDTHTAANLAEARNLLDTYPFDVCLSDMRLPDGNGIEFLRVAHDIQPGLPVAVITAHGNMEAAVDAMKNGAFDFVSKPVDLGLLRKLVLQAIEANPQAANDPRLQCAVYAERATPRTLEVSSKRDQSRTGDKTLLGEERLIGRSLLMQELKTMIGKVARTNAPVWVTGESGTGKELIARLIHDNSPRAQAPFVAVNCGAIPSELMESEMFGHLKGSFTGAHTDREGLFKKAQGGTLFLDEVAELPLHMQVKLLRAIQERSIKPVGSSDEINVDVRILSASHADLADGVKQGSFRNDLYYRLNVICIESPALRSRRDDIPLLVDYIMAGTASRSQGTQGLAVSDHALDRLMRYDFPGNIRELENLLERASALCDGNTITPEDIALDGLANRPALTTESTSTRGQSPDQHRIEQTLQQTRWNRREAADILGISYRQLRYRIQKLGLDNPDTHK